WHGNVVEAAEQFRDRFTFTDHALGLEFKDKERLTEFLAKAREFFPDSFAFTMPSSRSTRERLLRQASLGKGEEM
ncbi:MAG TPA: hypothetical protein VKD72_33425, partial [Gemmataceae bacterium]|nr:hypothetical protein [Gemmataceae bacterium]